MRGFSSSVLSGLERERLAERGALRGSHPGPEPIPAAATDPPGRDGVGWTRAEGGDAAPETTTRSTVASGDVMW